MRILALLTTAVVCVSCITELEDVKQWAPDTGASLVYYMDLRGGKTGEEDPWDTIAEVYAIETVHTGKSGEEDPWDTIASSFGEGSVSRGRKVDEVLPSSAVFVSFELEPGGARYARIVEARGQVIKLCYTDGTIQFVVDAPEGWLEGTWLEVDFEATSSKHDLPLLGVCTWRKMTAREGAAMEMGPTTAETDPWDDILVVW